MFKRINKIAIFASILLSIASCDRKDDVVQVAQNQFFVTGGGANARSAGIVNGFSIYEISPTIMGYFNHYCQKDFSSSSIPNLNNYGCGPVSYTMATRCIQAYKGGLLNPSSWSDKAKQVATIAGCPMGIANLPSYVNSYDFNNYINYVTQFGLTSNEDMKNFIQNSLYNDAFVLCPVNAYLVGATYIANGATVQRVNNPIFFSADPNVNPDLSTVENSSSNYISQSDEGGKVDGHFVLVTRLYRANSSPDNSYVEYIDPIAQEHSPSNRRYCNLARFVQAMKMNGNNSYIDAMSIYAK